jgi:hypothetical protein
MATRSSSTVFNQGLAQSLAPKNAVAESGGFAAGLALSALSYPVHAAPSRGGDTVQGLCDALLKTMKKRPDIGSKAAPEG